MAAVLAGLVAAAPAHARVVAPSVDEPTQHGPSEGTAPDQEARVAEAREHYGTGQELFEQQRYREAAYAFERSYAAIEDPNMLYNIAAAYELAELPLEAIRNYEQYLETVEVSQDERTEIETSLVQLRGRVGSIAIEIPDDVRVTSTSVDGEPVASTDFPRLSTPGLVKLTVRGEAEHEVMERTLDVVAGETVVVTVDFPPKPKPAATPKPKPTPTPVPTPPPVDSGRDGRAVRSVFWTTFALTLASGIAVGVLGGLARREAKAFNDAKQKCRPRCEPDPDDMTKPSVEYPHAQLDRAQELQVATNAMIGVTAALGAASVVLGAIGFRKRDRNGRRARARSASVRLSGSGVVVHW